MSWGSSAAATVTPNTPGLRRLGRVQVNVEDEAEKLARRIREGTIKPAPVIQSPKDDSAYFKASARLAQAIATARADAETSRRAIERYTEQGELLRQSEIVQGKLLRAEQALTLAKVTEAALMEEMEVIDIAYLAVVALSITLQ